MNPFSETPIVMQALPRWDGLYASTSLKVAQELSRNRIVFYVDHPFTWKDSFTAKYNRQLIYRKNLWKKGNLAHHPFEEYPNLINICPKPIPSINFLPEGAVYNQCRALNNNIVWAYIDKVLDQYGISEFIYINSFDPVYSQIRTDKDVVMRVYHCVDHTPGERYIARHGTIAEREFVRKADFVVSTSKQISKRLRKWNQKCYTVENAADFAFFVNNAEPIPEDIANIKHPRVVYVGNIGLRIDYLLLEVAAKKLPDFQFVFVGPVDEREFKGAELKKLPNVHFLGRRPYKEVPAYMNAGDICMIPFECTEYTKHIYPLKINEYLSLGKPVVTSQFADLSDFDDVILRYKDVDEFVQKVQQGLAACTEEDTHKRKIFAAGNTWEKRIEQWKEILKAEEETVRWNIRND
ncbi:glycosyltransferase [Limibacter armeniacum]|uniref:glycosyltransferase n=1 Tax=Limibacter armeniacum TaxID=466084 RepID=UPI002FE62F25